MPELPEVEVYRRMAEATLGRTIAAVDAHDPVFLKRGLTADALAAVLVGASFGASRRTGKLLLLDVEDGEHTLGLRFGLSGRLVVDGVTGMEEMQYSPLADVPRWVRFGLDFADGGHLRINDPRHFGGVELDPDEARLGPDALSLTPEDLRHALEGTRMPLKTRLMDQSRIAGVGNLIVDEVLWRAGFAPTRPARSLAPDDVDCLYRELRATVEDLIRTGGSHTGQHVPARVRGGLCPRDATPLRREPVGGRTTYWCPAHQH